MKEEEELGQRAKAAAKKSEFSLFSHQSPFAFHLIPRLVPSLSPNGHQFDINRQSLARLVSKRATRNKLESAIDKNDFFCWWSPSLISSPIII